MWTGELEAIYIAPEPGAAMIAAPAVNAVAGAGLEGDRFFGKGSAHGPKPGSGTEVTLIEAEALEAFERECHVKLERGATRRNLITRGVPLNHLVGKTFRVGEVVLEGRRLCEPCEHLAGVTHEKVLPGLVHRGGLRAAIRVGGALRVGDAMSPTSDEGP